MLVDKTVLTMRICIELDLLFRELFGRWHIPPMAPDLPEGFRFFVRRWRRDFCDGEWRISCWGPLVFIMSFRLCPFSIIYIRILFLPVVGLSAWLSGMSTYTI